MNIDRKSRKQILSENIKRLLKSNGLTEREAAQLSGLKPTTLNSWICMVSYPREANLMKLSEALHVEIGELIEENDRLRSYKDQGLSAEEIALLTEYQHNPIFHIFVDNGLLALLKGKLEEANRRIKALL